MSDAKDDLPEPPELTTINKENVDHTIAKLNEVLGNKKHIDKMVKAKLNYINRNFSKNIQKYQEQEAILGEWNSYSKTDRDATFMRMKEDHMGNGQLKPACNTQISTFNQYTVNYTVRPNPTDTTTLSPHLGQHQQSFGFAPRSLTADAGYGSEQNYTILENLNVEDFVKYGKFDKDRAKIIRLNGLSLPINYSTTGSRTVIYSPWDKKWTILEMAIEKPAPDLSKPIIDINHKAAQTVL